MTSPRTVSPAAAEEASSATPDFVLAGAPSQCPDLRCCLQRLLQKEERRSGGTIAAPTHPIPALGWLLF